MNDSSNGCTERLELESRVQEILRRLASLAAQEAEILRSGDEPKMDAIDEDLENTLGEKERAIGALKQHRYRHGC